MVRGAHAVAAREAGESNAGGESGGMLSSSLPVRASLERSERTRESAVVPRLCVRAPLPIVVSELHRNEVALVWAAFSFLYNHLRSSFTSTTSELEQADRWRLPEATRAKLAIYA